ncbi:hypothetical protein Nepgr_021627 [Nepenthes gracilis]|uniref:Uncharacterized protein n=1 Tax=Nepenthes gracilis TaxID=150966 RepID=A0AAD3XXJ9_NEPGR|nr:hypothetical protein Nepgr_021627 [Nepenthes gracilis]
MNMEHEVGNIMGWSNDLQKQGTLALMLPPIFPHHMSPLIPDGAGEEEEHWGGSPVFVTRACRSDEDVGWWVAEPGIDQRASAFIAKFYETRVSDPEFQAVPV